MNARDYLNVLRERKLLVLGSIIACIALAAAATALIPKSFSSSVSFYVVAGPRSLENLQNPTSDLYSGAQLARDRIKSYRELVIGPRVADDAAKALGGGWTGDDVRAGLSASSPKDTVVMTVTATDGSAAGAEAVLRSVSRAFTQLVDQLETPAGETRPAVRVEQLQQPSEAAAVAPKLSLNLFFGALVGIVVGFGLAIFRSSMDVSLKSSEALEAATEAAVLGVVPEDSSELARAGSGPRAEAIRRIRTNLEYANVDGNSRVMVMTSAVADEGKTTMACELGGALAAVGNRVVIVNGDLRRPPGSEAAALGKPIGLTTVLTGRVDLYRAVQMQEMNGCDVLASGRHPPRPNELLSSDRAQKVLGELRERYDFVIIDTPPVLAVADALNLGIHADGAVIVCRFGRTGRHEVAAAAAALRSVSIPIIGTALTRAPRRAGTRWTEYEGDEHEGDADEAGARESSAGRGNGSRRATRPVT